MNNRIITRIANYVIAASVAVSPVLAAHVGEENWRCPYTPDGVCTPKRHTYGHHQTRWSRWPGVTDIDYQSKIAPGELSAPAGPKETAPRESLDELLLPPSNSQFDRAPAPPPLTPEAEQPDILEPPGEDIMDELLPKAEVDPENAKSNADAGSDDDAAPPPLFDDELKPEAEETPKTSPRPKSPKPFEDDPFFDDEAPAPPSKGDGSGLNLRPDAEGPTMPAMQSAPGRLPTAQTPPQPLWPKSRLTQVTKPAAARPQPPTDGKSAAVGRSRDRRSDSPGRWRNPLRNEPAPEMVAVDDEVVPTAAWQQSQPAESEPESGWHPNPLRAQ